MPRFCSPAKASPKPPPSAVRRPSPRTARPAMARDPRGGPVRPGAEGRGFRDQVEGTVRPGGAGLHPVANAARRAQFAERPDLCRHRRLHPEGPTALLRASPDTPAAAAPVREANSGRPPPTVPADDKAKAALAARKARLDALMPVTDALLANPPEADWLIWRRTWQSQGFSPLKQVDKANVGSLRPAWSWNLPPSSNETTPLCIRASCSCRAPMRSRRSTPPPASGSGNTSALCPPRSTTAGPAGPSPWRSTGPSCSSLPLTST